jgi:hypothetical protein
MHLRKDHAYKRKIIAFKVNFRFFSDQKFRKGKLRNQSQPNHFPPFLLTKFANNYRYYTLRHNLVIQQSKVR